MAESQTRYLFWDGIPNVVNGRLVEGSECKYALSDKEQKYQERRKPPRTVIVNAGADRPVPVVARPPTRLRIYEVDESFAPGEQFLSVKLRLRPLGANTSVLVRIYQGDRLVHHEVYGSAQIKRMPTTDPRPTIGEGDAKKPVPRKNTLLGKSKAKDGALAGPAQYTVRAWIAQKSNAFAGSATKTDAQIGALSGVSSYDARSTVAGAAADKYADKPGRNQTRVLAARQYDSAQLIAFDIRPTYSKGERGQRVYRGKGTGAQDMDARVAIMKAAIEKAAGDDRVLNRDASVLKIFMAPEFFFRGRSGGYALEDVSGLLDKLRAETSKEAYKDWLFVFGTAVAYLKHEEKPQQPKMPVRHKVFVEDAILQNDEQGDYTQLQLGNAPGCEDPQVSARSHSGNWFAIQGQHEGWIFADGKPGDRYLLNVRGTGFARGPCFLEEPTPAQMKKHPIQIGRVLRTLRVGGMDVSELIVTEQAGCEKPAVTQRTNSGWILSQGDPPVASGRVTAHDIDNGQYLLGARGTGYRAGPADLLEPVGTEIFNVALVQRGARGAESLVVYKEFISQLDFVERGALFLIHAENRRLQSTAGARKPAQRIDDAQRAEGDRLSELNKSGLGGGSVFTIDGITFGLEVCLDHGVGRVAHFYRTAAKKGDPRVQIQLIPAWGMDIEQQSVCCVDDGLVFRVDGDDREGRGGCDAMKSPHAGQPLQRLDKHGDALPVAPEKIALEDYFKAGAALVIYRPAAIPPPEKC